MPSSSGERHGKRWTAEEDEKLRTMAAGGSWLHHIAKSLKRYPEAVQQRASKLGIGLNWVVQQPKGHFRFEYSGELDGKTQITVWAASQAEGDKLALAEFAVRRGKANMPPPNMADLHLISVTARGTEF